MRWTRSDLIDAADRYEREVRASSGDHYAELAAEEARRFVRWLPADGRPEVDPLPSEHPPHDDGDRADAPPTRLRAVVEAWIASGRPAQPPSRWDRSPWVAMLREHERYIARLPDELDRPTVRELAARGAESDKRAVEAYLASMIWGFGKVPLGPFRTHRILDQGPDVPRRLRDAFRAVTRSAAEGYDHLAGPGRTKFLGPAFGTKLLFFTQPDGARPVALILDAYVAEGLGLLADTRLNPLPWSRPRYARYLELMHRWADDLGVAPDELECVVFQWVADRRGGQWADQG